MLHAFPTVVILPSMNVSFHHVVSICIPLWLHVCVLGSSATADDQGAGGAAVSTAGSFYHYRGVSIPALSINSNRAV